MSTGTALVRYSNYAPTNYVVVVLVPSGGQRLYVEHSTVGPSLQYSLVLVVVERQMVTIL